MLNHANILQLTINIRHQGLLLGWLLSLYPDLGQPAGGGGVLVHHGGGDLVLALLLGVLVSSSAFSESWPTLVKVLGRVSAGSWSVTWTSWNGELGGSSGCFLRQSQV